MQAQDFFEKQIKETEVDSMLISDETLLLELGKSSEDEYLIYQGKEGRFDNLSQVEKISALLTVFAKFTNSKEAILEYNSSNGSYPVYFGFEDSNTGNIISDGIKSYMDEVSQLDDVDTKKIISYLQLQPMPVAVESRSDFDGITEYDSQRKIVICIDGPVAVKYHNGSYAEGTIDRLVRAYYKALEWMESGLDMTKLSMVDDGMIDELNQFLDNTVDYDSSVTVVDLLNHAIEMYPEEIAVVYNDISLTYRELGAVTDKVAAYIHNKGIGPEDVVSILIGRNQFMPITAIGVLKAGAAYQPLDSTYPEERLNFMIQDANAKLLIAQQNLLSKVSEYKGDVLLISEIESLPEADSSINFSKKDGLFILLYTSGSTGVPKGVMLEHQNLVAFIDWYKRYYKVDNTSRAAAYASFGFDADMMDMYPILSCGGQLHIIDEAIRLELLKLNAYFEENKITHSFITTQVGRQYATMFGDAPYPHYLSIGGETLVPMDPPSGYQFFNVYGPTECTILITAFHVDKLYHNVPIGTALDNIHLYILDANLNRLPVGVPGELCVAGPQVARGYLNREEQTKKAFVRNPYDNAYPYDRIYRTGDIVRYLPDGRIEFIGRRDSQVKIRGFRIELSEVEGIIREYPSIKDATVLAFDEAGGGKYIVAYIVSDEQVSISALNDFIRENKPPYMVPAVTMQIDKIPLNQNQKVDKRALPKPERQDVERVLPKNDRQTIIYDVLKNILQHDEFGITTNFADAGLTSVASIRFIVELTRALNVPVTIQDINEYPTIEQLEDFLGKAEDDYTKEERACYPLTQTQMGIYVECLRNPESVQYNLPGAFALSKDVDIDKLKAAIKTVMDAHKSMKCVIHEDEDGEICMYPRLEDAIEIEEIDGSESQWEDYFASYAVPFNMKDQLLFRFTLYKTEAHVYLVIDFHHIVSDGSSIAVFSEELNRVLKGQEPEGEIFSQYDVALMEIKKRQSDAYKEAKAFYDSIYLGASASFSLEGDLKDKEEGCGFYKVFDEVLSKAEVERFCEENKITENVFFTSVMGYVMGQYNHSEDSIFTTIYNGRNDSRTMNTFGMMVKTLPVYSNFPNDMSISEYMAKAQKQLMDSMRHDVYSFAEISNAYGIKPELIFVYQGDDFVEFEIGDDTTVFHEAVPDKAKANISFNIFVEDGKYRFEFEYMSHIYSQRFIELLYDVYVHAASSFLKSLKISEIEILSEKEAARIDHFNDTNYPVEIKSVNKLFEAWVKKIPEQTAVIACGESLTYRELNQMANKVANGLIRRGLNMNTLVGLVLEREKNVYITRQGIIKAGGGFLPLVTEYPDDRIDFCLKDADCQFVITTEAIKKDREELFKDKTYQVLTVEELLGDDSTSDENPNLDIDPSNICYCLYTSGSTGRPKGVLIEHKTLCNFVNANPKNIKTKCYTDKGKVSLALAAITFDVSVLEEFVPLTNGMTLCMANDDEIHNPLQLGELLLSNKVDIMKCTPSFMMSIVDIPEMAPALKQIKVFDIGAETFPPVLFSKLRKVNPTADIINSYGPTECTISSTSKLLKPDGVITIGGPLTNIKLYVVNSSNKSLPVGISGELIICGAGVGRGYMNLPDKTKEAFFTYKGLPAYHSGDLVRWSEYGEIDFLGRIDNQVKLRGLRVELDEVESAINSYEGIKTCKVMVKKNANDEFLVAYFTAITEIDKEQLTEHISSMLAHYMVPAVMMQLDEMPLTNHGKIDKKRLPEIEYAAEEREYIAPETALEKELCDKYAEILALEKVSVCDSFFEIGGTSLSATKVVMYCNSKGYTVVYKDIFANESPRALAKLIQGDVGEKKDSSNIKNFDYTNVNEVIKQNVFDPKMKVARKNINGVLLTGATGFLGIHVFRELIKGDYGKVFCLVRKGGFESSEKRLNTLYMYYYGTIITEEEWKNIECINADITDTSLESIFADYSFDTIINCAACVKHFVQDDLLDRINVRGVENLIKLALAKDAELVHVSTASVAGEGNEDTVPFSKHMSENELYFNQIIENDYIRTKFLAERAILSNISENGLKAKIMRVGNLMSRKEDGEFQINFVTNGFMRSLKAYKSLKCFPMGMMHAKAEFSPIDSTAQAIVTLMQCDENYTIFHAFNSHRLYMSDVIYNMNEYGFEIEVVSDEEFAQVIHRAEKDENLSDIVLGLIAYDSSDGKPRYEIVSDNRFTAEVLYRMGYKWPVTTDEYIQRAIEALDGLDFFDK